MLKNINIYIFGNSYQIWQEYINFEGMIQEKFLKFISIQTTINGVPALDIYTSDLEKKGFNINIK